MNETARRSSAFSLALQLVKSLQDGVGAVVSEYDVDPDGSVRVQMGVRPRSWPFRIARHSVQVAHVDQFLAEARACLVRSRQHHAAVDRFLRGSPAGICRLVQPDVR